MSQSGAVYQPTTVTYESNGHPQDRWHDRPISYLASSVSQAARRPCGISCIPSRTVLPVVLLTSCIACFSLGMVMLIHGAIGYSSDTNKEEVYLFITIFGAIFFGVSILIFAFFLRLTRRFCWRNVKDHLDSGGQSLTVNPSTDLLVAAQYAPVPEVAYQPPHEDSEQSKLMPQENKDLNNEDTDRMVERDPRIVLRPLNTPAHEET